MTEIFNKTSHKQKINAANNAIFSDRGDMKQSLGRGMKTGHAIFFFKC